MRPEQGGDEMEESTLDPAELFADIGLLITEARTPDSSPKGRIEGPHCPPSKGLVTHQCDKRRLQCQKSGELKKHMMVLSKNKIPMRIDVLLLPGCQHGQVEANAVVGPPAIEHEDVILLERWDVLILPKRTIHGSAGGMDSQQVTSGRNLTQAVRSYLHFSQLSSWLASQKGSLPFLVVYKAYAPGESVDHGFTSTSQLHKFPVADLDEAFLRVTVNSVQRSEHIPLLLCVNDRNQKQITGKRHSPEIWKHLTEPDLGHLESSGSVKFLYHESKYAKFSSSASQRSLDSLVKKDGFNHDSFKISNVTSPKELEVLKNSCVKKRSQTQNLQDNFKRNYESSTSNTRQALHPKTKTPVPHSASCLDPIPSTPNSTLSTKVTSIGPKGRPSLPHGAPSSCSQLPPATPLLTTTLTTPTTTITPHTSTTTDTTKLKESFKKNPLDLSPSEDTVYDIYGNSYDKKTLVSRLPSPKVLLTKNPIKGTHTYFKKRRIDLENSVENDTCNLLEDKLMSDSISDSLRPLKAEDFEAFISDFSSQGSAPYHKSQLSDIPLTKCKFFIGEEASGKLPNCDTSLTTSSDKSNTKTEVTTVIPDSKQHISKRNLFRKSLSEPSTKEWRTYAIDFDLESLSPKRDVPLGFRSGQGQIDVEDLSENDSTPTNSLSESFLKVDREGPGSPIRPFPFRKMSPLTVSREVTPTLELETHSISSPAVIDLSQQFSDLHLSERPCLSASPTNVHCQGQKVKSVDNVSKSVDNLISKNGFSDDSCIQNGNSTQENGVAVNDSNDNSSQEEAMPSTSSQERVGRKKMRESRLCQQLLKKELKKTLIDDGALHTRLQHDHFPNAEDIFKFRKELDRSSSMLFNSSTGLPSRSSPAPVKRKSGRFDYDNTLINARAIKNALSCSKLTLQSESSNGNIDNENPRILSTSAPASTNCLLGNFEESMLNGRIEPAGVVEGFTAEIGAGGSFCPKHLTLPVNSYFFQLSDDNAPSPYLGHINLDCVGRRGYHIPKTGTVQVTLFNPNKTVVKMFVVMYDLSDMPPNCQTFLRQRTMYMPVDPESIEPSYLRYLIHLRFSSSKTGKIYLHTDIRLIFARDKFEYDSRVANYQLRSFTEGPQNPKYSPKR